MYLAVDFIDRPTAMHLLMLETFALVKVATPSHCQCLSALTNILACNVIERLTYRTPNY